METKTLKLKKPIQLGKEGEPISSLTIQKPKAKHLRKLPMGATTLSDMLDFAGRLTGLNPPEIDELDAEDALALFEVIQDFLPAGLKSGPKGSA